MDRRSTRWLVARYVGAWLVGASVFGMLSWIHDPEQGVVVIVVSALVWAALAGGLMAWNTPSAPWGPSEPAGRPTERRRSARVNRVLSGVMTLAGAVFSVWFVWSWLAGNDPSGQRAWMTALWPPLTVLFASGLGSPATAAHASETVAPSGRPTSHARWALVGVVVALLTGLVVAWPGPWRPVALLDLAAAGIAAAVYLRVRRATPSA